MSSRLSLPMPLPFSARVNDHMAGGDGLVGRDRLRERLQAGRSGGEVGELLRDGTSIRQRERRSLVGGQPDIDSMSYDELLQRFPPNTRRGVPDSVIDATTSGFVLAQSAAADEALSDEITQCCVCLCPFQDGENLRLLPCLHRFHDGCARHWLRVDARCPLCQYSLRDGVQASADVLPCCAASTDQNSGPVSVRGIIPGSVPSPMSSVSGGGGGAGASSSLAGRPQGSAHTGASAASRNIRVRFALQPNREVYEDELHVDTSSTVVGRSSALRNAPTPPAFSGLSREDGSDSDPSVRHLRNQAAGSGQVVPDEEDERTEAHDSGGHGSSERNMSTDLLRREVNIPQQSRQRTIDAVEQQQRDLIAERLRESGRQRRAMAARAALSGRAPSPDFNADEESREAQDGAELLRASLARRDQVVARAKAAADALRRQRHAEDWLDQVTSVPGDATSTDSGLVGAASSSHDTSLASSGSSNGSTSSASGIIDEVSAATPGGARLQRDTEALGGVSDIHAGFSTPQTSAAAAALRAQSSADGMRRVLAAAAEARRMRSESGTSGGGSQSQIVPGLESPRILVETPRSDSTGVAAVFEQAVEDDDDLRIALRLSLITAREEERDRSHHL